IEYFDVDGVGVGVRRAGDSWLLVEFGDMVLDIELRFYVHRLMRLLANENIAGVLELTPGIRSLQIHYDCLRVEEAQLLALVRDLCQSLITDDGEAIPARIVYLPLSWDDEQCRLAIEKYQQVVRKDAPWYPSNIEFIRRINGLDSMEEVKRIVFD
ncbi:MAG: carboxyltransferase domain-containing protein, partial [Pseudomonadales bacterium]